MRIRQRENPPTKILRNQGLQKPEICEKWREITRDKKSWSQRREISRISQNRESHTLRIASVWVLYCWLQWSGCDWWGFARGSHSRSHRGSVYDRDQNSWSWEYGLDRLISFRRCTWSFDDLSQPVLTLAPRCNGQRPSVRAAHALNFFFSSGERQRAGDKEWAARPLLHSALSASAPRAALFQVQSSKSIL